ncbi:hypothetical protein NU219Hw_g8536t1 [Hortaea werneckii]
MRLALTAVGLAAVTHGVGAEALQEGNTSPWWQRAWTAGSQLINRNPDPQDGQDAPIVTVTQTVSEDQCPAVQIVTSTVTPETTATVITTKETTTTQYVYPSEVTTGDANDEKTVVITPSDYGVDLPPVTTTVTRYPTDHSWDHSWTAGSWNSEWEGNTATYTMTISEIEMPVTSTIYSGAESPTATGLSTGPNQDTTELSPAGPTIVTKTVTISNVEIPWTTTKTASQEVVTTTFTTTAGGSNGGQEVVTSTFTTTAGGSNGGQEVVTTTFTTTADGSNGGQEVVTSTFTTTADGSNGGQEVVTTTFTTTADGSNGGQEVVTTTFTTTADGSNGGAIQPTTITEGNAPQTTVATQPGESAGSMGQSSYVYTTVTYTSRLPPFQNPNGTSAATATTNGTKLPMTNGTQPSTSSLTTVTSTFLVPAPTAVETQYTTTFVSGGITQTTVVTERPTYSPTSAAPASTAIETEYTTTLVSGDTTRTVVVTDRPSYSTTSAAPASTAIETEYTTTFVSGGTTQTTVVTERPSYSPTSAATETQYTTTLVSGNTTQTSVVTERPSNSQSSLLASSSAPGSNLTSTFTNTFNGRPNSRSSSETSPTLSSASISASEMQPEGSSSLVPGTNSTISSGAQPTPVPGTTSSGLSDGQPITPSGPVSNAGDKRFGFFKSDFIRSAAADDYERLHELKRLLGPPAFEVVKLIKRSHKPAYHLSIELFSTSGVVYIAGSVTERFGIAAFVQLLGLVRGSISDLTILSKLDVGVLPAFEFAKYVNCLGFDFNEPSTFRNSKLDYGGASAYIYLGIFYGDLLELPELLGPPTYEIV